MPQDPGTYTPEAGRTWPDWTVLRYGDGEMTTVRSDAVAFQDSAMRLGTMFIRPDASIWLFTLYAENDPLQGGALFPLKLVR